MLRQILRRTLSALLAILMVMTAMSAAGTIIASAKITATNSANASNVTFVVPEAIYLKPTWNSYYQSQQMPFQIYVNNTLDSSGTMTLSKEESTQGLMYFNYGYASSVKIMFEWLSDTGSTVFDGNVTFGDSISRTAGMAYTATPSFGPIPITAGTSPTMSPAQTGAYLRWTATFTDTQDKREKTAVAYTYVYKPYVQPVGLGIRTENDRGTNTFGSILTWIGGLHDTQDGSDGEKYPNTTTSNSGYGLLPISSSVSNGVKVGNLYAQLASTDSSVSRFRHNDFSNKNPDNWLNETTSPLYVPDKSFRHINNKDSSGNGDKAFYTFDWSPVGVLTVDVSRYGNLNQIPNLSIGLLVTDDEASCSGGAWFVSNYTGASATSYIKDYNTNNTSNAENLWNKYGKASSTVTIISSEGSYSNPTASEAEGIKYNGRWPRAISSTTSSGLFMVGAGYFNREDSDGSHYGGDTIWDVAELRANITFYNKTELRSAVQNAIKNSATLQAVFYDTTSTAWKNYQNLYQAAAMALTKLDGTFYATATVGGSTNNYSSPSALASALNGAVNTLLQGTGRVSRTAKQTIVGLQQQSNGTYKCIGINGSIQKNSASFTTFQKVTISADSIDGYTFKGLVATNYDQNFTIGSTVSLPTSYTTSLTGATISDGTITYSHAGTDGTDGSGNLYFTYYYFANPYTVAFDPNGGTGTMDNQSFIYNVEQRLYANTFTRRAYTFGGWAKSASGSILYQDEELVSNLTTTNNGTVTLYAKWTPASYTITYNTAGGSLTGTYTTTYTIEQAIGLPNAVKPGYTLSGWRSSPSGAGNWGEMTYGVSASVEAGKYGNVTMNAQWTAITYSVVFNGNGSTSGSMNPQTFTYEVSQQLTANAFTCNGCTFAGWALSENATSALFKDKAVVSEPLTTVGGSTVTLYAVWQPINYTITYSAEGGTIHDSDLQYTSRYTVKEAIQLPVQVDRTGYTFLGWKPTTNEGNWSTQSTYKNLLSAGMYGNITLNAQWSAQSYTILYDALEGNITSTSYTTSYDVTTTVTLPNATKEGYLLSGWDANGAGNWGETLYVVGSVAAGRYGDVTMTARWTGVTYLVAFNGNNSTDGIMFNQTMQYGVATTLTTNAYVRNGYDFLGWSLSNTAQSPTYADGASVINLSYTQGATVTLFAVWSKNTYTITYDAAGGTITAEGTQTYSVNDRVSMPTAERTGYTLIGWVPETSVGSWLNLTPYNDMLEAGQYGNVHLIARWNKTVYAIRYDAVGGTMSGRYTTEYSVDTEIVLPTIERTGYAFGGWQSDDAWDNIIVTDYVPTGLLGDVVLQAIWVQRNYTVHFNACGASGQMDDQIMQFDHDQTLRINTFTYPGYTFSGWAVVSGGAAIYANGATVYNLSEEDNGTVELYAVWVKRSFTVTYNLNGASGSLIQQSATMDGAAITLRNYAPGAVFMNGIPFEFSGWAYTQEEADNGIVSYTNKASFAVTSEVLEKATVDWSTSKPTITLFAVWTNIQVTLLPGENASTVIDNENNIIYGLKLQVSEAEMRNTYLQLNGYGSIELEYSGYVGTGAKVIVKNTQGTMVDTYTVVIFGDVDGDGIVTTEDVRAIKGHVSGAAPIADDSPFAEAGDLDNDGTLTMQDAILMKALINHAQEYDQVNQRLI